MSALAVLAAIHLIVGVLLAVMFGILVIHAAVTCLPNAFFCAISNPILRGVCWLRGQGV